MADSPQNTGSESPDVPEVDLRDARLAAFLAWLIPGLGHFYQRRTGKGMLFMTTILCTFVYGMYLGNGRVVYAATTKLPTSIQNIKQMGGRWHYYCQLPIGVAALPAYVQTWRVESGDAPLDFFGDNFERPPYTPETAERLFPDKAETEINQEYFQTTDHSKNVVMHASEREKWHHDLNFFFELGTVFTMIAGLMNVLAICDARWGPLVVLPDKESQKT